MAATDYINHDETPQQAAERLAAAAAELEAQAEAWRVEVRGYGEVRIRVSGHIVNLDTDDLDTDDLDTAGGVTPLYRHEAKALGQALLHAAAEADAAFKAPPSKPRRGPGNDS